MPTSHSLLIAALMTTALTTQEGGWRISEAPAELRATVSRADLMIAAMHDSVLRELSDALDRVGPEGAINSCHIDSLLMTQRIAREGAAAGRTSDRLRNPTNVAKPWAAEIVRSNAGRQAREVEGFVVDLGKTVGVLRPISQRRICANCHGPVENLRPGVRAALAERYPADKATGFKEGEIRGWFWVELPKQPR